MRHWNNTENEHEITLWKPNIVLSKLKMAQLSPDTTPKSILHARKTWNMPLPGHCYKYCLIRMMNSMIIVLYYGKRKTKGRCWSCSYQLPLP